MLQFILMLLGLTFPNNNGNTHQINHNQTEVSQTANNAPDDTGGETHIPPKR